MRPKLLGNLIPATYNLWIGGSPASGAPTCSGGIYGSTVSCVWMFACLILGFNVAFSNHLPGWVVPRRAYTIRHVLFDYLHGSSGECSRALFDVVFSTYAGLHHDYHDNLYVLIKGEKIFELYAPSDAACMYTKGEIDKVYPNGRIVYKGAGEGVNADGSDPAGTYTAIPINPQT
jgi:hypothetical protein